MTDTESRISSDAELVALYRQEYKALAQYARLVTMQPAGADDLAQEAFLRLGMRRNWPDHIEEPVAYLRRTVLNLARNLARSQSRRRAREERVGRDESRVVPGADTRFDGIAGDLADALRALPPRQRAALVLRYYEDRELADVARCMGTSVGTVKTHVHRGLSRLRDSLPAGRAALAGFPEGAET